MAWRIIYRFMLFLPREWLIWRGTPKGIKLFNTLKIGGYGLGMAMLIVPANRSGVKGRNLHRRIRQCLRNDLHILDLTHQGLIVMHTLYILEGKARRYGIN